MTGALGFFEYNREAAVRCPACGWQGSEAAFELTRRLYEMDGIAKFWPDARRSRNGLGARWTAQGVAQPEPRRIGLKAFRQRSVDGAAELNDSGA